MKNWDVPLLNQSPTSAGRNTLLTVRAIASDAEKVLENARMLQAHYRVAELRKSCGVEPVEECAAWRGAYELERLQKELSECRGLLADVMATAPHDAPNRTSIKAAADWLANWNGERI